MSKTKNITQSRLKELLCYDLLSGSFTWIARPSKRVHIGDVAGSHHKDGYIYIRIDNVLYKAHRLAFMYVLGWMPEQVDHDDQVRDNNRWMNLNPATNAINGKNQTLRCTNTSGHVGVSWDNRRQKWLAYITVNRKKSHLGSFTDKSDAIATRQAADIEHDFHVNHGNRVSHLPL